jgi:CRISPR-associated endonuclease/helicase Cas3
MLHLRVLPVYSELSSQQIGPTRLLKHQAETLEAFQDPNTDIVINTAMTGDGKSLAAYLPVFQLRQYAMAMYPTNELIRDQYNSISMYEHKLNMKVPRHEMMYSDKITQLMKEHENSVRLEEVRKLLERNVILLTNPDLIHLMMSHQYGWSHMRKELAVTIGAYFDYFLFDEFHVFGVPQIVSVMNMLGYLTVNYRNKPNNRKKFVFLSATPSKLLDGLLERSGLRSKKIGGHYSSSAHDDAYRCILQPCDIELHEINQEPTSTGQRTASTERWIEEHLEEILHFFQQYPGTKAAILVSSPATARRLLAFLKEHLPHDITVGENTGLTPIEDRADAFNKHILVGTSTVDIGVDFHINLLIFEAFGAGSFLQRFGRLGRHDEFRAYRAYGLVPRFVLERLQNAFATEHEVERERFNEAIRQAFPTEQEFKSYTSLWGVVQAAHVIAEMQGQSKMDANQAFTEALTEQYEGIYGQQEEPVMPKALKKYWRLSKQFPEILKELLSFRGQSPLECGVWDTTAITEKHPDGQFLTYDLFFLLSNTEFEVISEERFLWEVKKQHLEEKGFKDKLLYIKVHSYVQERLGLILGLPHNLSEHAQVLHHMQVTGGFVMLEPRPIWLDQVNRRLKKLKLTCIISDMQRKELKQRLELGAVFPVYRLQDSAGHEYSIAFGQEALLLESVLFFRKPKSTSAIMA